MAQGKQELGTIQRLEAGDPALPQRSPIKKMATGRFSVGCYQRMMLPAHVWAALTEFGGLFKKNK